MHMAIEFEPGYDTPFYLYLVILIWFWEFVGGVGGRGSLGNCILSLDWQEYITRAYSQRCRSQP